MGRMGPGNVLVGLEVPVYDPVGVQVLDGEHRLREVVARHVGRQRARAQQRGAVPALDELQDKAQVTLRLERAVHRHLNVYFYIYLIH